VAVLTSMRGKKQQKGKYPHRSVTLIGGGERERVWASPSSRRWTLASSWTGEQASRAGFPSPGSLIGGLGMVF
jgi:hypothetical protein